MLAQEVDMPAMHIGLAGLNHMPSLPDELGQALFGVGDLDQAQRCLNVNLLALKFDHRHVSALNAKIACLHSQSSSSPGAGRIRAPSTP